MVAFPFTDLATAKMRPALVVSSDDFNGQNLDLILVAITSQIPKKAASTDHALAAEDHKQAGLPKPSLVKVGKIVTLDQRLIRKKLGRISDPTLQSSGDSPEASSCSGFSCPPKLLDGEEARARKSYKPTFFPAAAFIRSERECREGSSRSRGQVMENPRLEKSAFGDWKLL
jgi:mRNA interferase MazF